MAASRIKTRDPFTMGTMMVPSSNPSMMRGDGADDDDEEGGEREEGGRRPPNDHELMKLMMARLAIMEKKIQNQEQEIRTKDRRIKVLEDKLRIVGQSRAAANNSNSSNSAGADNNNAATNTSTNAKHNREQELEQHCLLLQQQVHEMETFLADYGMVWIGDQDDPESDIYITDLSSDKERKRRQEAAGLELNDVDTLREQPLKVDFDQLLVNIRDLNVIAGEGESHIQRTTDGARLMRQEHVPLTFYANGLLMFEGPFRPYTDPTAIQCVADFLDGYFPSELQQRFPEGVPFSVRDMREVYFKPRKVMDVFSGVGNTLGGEVQPSRLIPTKLNQGQDGDYTGHANTSGSEGSVTSDLPFPPMKVDVFLNKLPNSVVKDGKVIDIRNSVGKTLTGGAASGSDKVQVAVVETAVTKSIQSTLMQAKDQHVRPKTPRDITTLRIKSETGGHSYVVKMRFKETIGDLKKYLDGHRQSVGQSAVTGDYDICSTYPRKTFADDAATMEACGLIPNGVLHLQAKKKT